jgi:hypothetical protein
MAHIMGFPLFPKLPGELRILVWQFALDNENCPEGRIVELHTCDPANRTVSIAISHTYPSLFGVSKEARAEAIKADGSEMVELGSGYSAKPGEAPTQVCLNFEKDTLFMSIRFEKPATEYFVGMKHRFAVFSTMLQPRAVRKITKLMMSVHRDTHSDGSGLEFLSGGALGKVTLLSPESTYAPIGQRTVQGYVKYRFYQGISVEGVASKRGDKSDGDAKLPLPEIEVLLIHGNEFIRITGTTCERKSDVVLPFSLWGLRKSTSPTDQPAIRQQMGNYPRNGSSGLNTLAHGGVGVTHMNLLLPRHHKT